jgi:plasmid stabilization system protein ParE
MPHIIYTPKALDDLVRLRAFLKDKNLEAAKRAVIAIRTAIGSASKSPERFRPVPNLPFYREIIIEFGGSGYIARFRHEPGQPIIIVRIKHQLEDEM